MTINNEIIRNLELYKLKGPMSDDLKAYLINRYSEEPVLYEYNIQGLYNAIYDDIDRYMLNELDTKIKSNEELLEDKLDEVLQAYSQAMLALSKFQDEKDAITEFIETYELSDKIAAFKGGILQSYVEETF